MQNRRKLASFLAFGLLGTASLAHAQRPILPMCSDDPSYKLLPCHATASQQPAQPAPADSNPFPFPGDEDSATPSQRAAQAKPADAKPTNPTPADQFPFPGDDPAQAASATKPNQPANTQSATPSAADRFPFPGETPATTNDPTLPADSHYAAGSSSPDDGASSSSSSSSGDDPNLDDPNLKDPNLKDGLKDLGSAGTTRSERRRLPKVEDIQGREDEDVRVSQYYHSTGNFLAAYLRAKDAVRIDPTDEDAQYALAINADKLAKRDEAIAGYTAYLKLAPDGKEAKQVQRALASLRESAASK
jgi:hypothetical protein